jgi:hypothetical protein
MVSGTTGVAVNVGNGTKVSVGSGVAVNGDSLFAPQALRSITSITQKSTSLDRTTILQNYKVPLN